MESADVVGTESADAAVESADAAVELADAEEEIEMDSCHGARPYHQVVNYEYESWRRWWPWLPAWKLDVFLGP